MDLREQLFAQKAVAELFTADFDMGGDVPICLKHKDCVLVMFHTNNEETDGLLKAWNQAAQQSIGPIFACCDLSRNQKVGLAFNSIHDDRMVGWAGLSKVPFILSYHNGYPADQYDGPYDVHSIVDYSLNMANKLTYDRPNKTILPEPYPKEVIVAESVTDPKITDPTVTDPIFSFGGVKVQPKSSNLKTSELPDLPNNKVYKVIQI